MKRPHHDTPPPRDLDDLRKRNAAARHLLEEWLADASGYEEETWPLLQERSKWSARLPPASYSVARRLVLAAGVLGQASHPRRNQPFAQWVGAMLATDTTVCVSEIADDEVRRELIRADRPVGLARLDASKPRSLTSRYPPHHAASR